MSHFYNHSKERLLLQKSRLEEEIDRLETSLQRKCNELTMITTVNIDKDLEMIKKMREFLLALKEEHSELSKTIGYSNENQNENIRPTSNMAINLEDKTDLDRLVRRVQEAIGDEPPRSPELRRYMQTSRYTQPETPPIAESPVNSFHYGELSIASQQYLHKYGLLQSERTSASPSSRHQSKHFREPFKPVAPSRLTFGSINDEPRDHSPSRHRSQRVRRDYYSDYLEGQLDATDSSNILPKIL